MQKKLYVRYVALFALAMCTAASAKADAILVEAAAKVSGTERDRVEFLRKGLHDGL